MCDKWLWLGFGFRRFGIVVAALAFCSLAGCGSVTGRADFVRGPWNLFAALSEDVVNSLKGFCGPIGKGVGLVDCE